MPILAYSAPSLAARLSGRILLAVEDKGKTYYVAPDGYRYQITRATAQKIFEKLALGITTANLEQIPIKEITVAPEVLPEPVERIVYVDRYLSNQCPPVQNYINEINDLNTQIDSLKEQLTQSGQTPVITPNDSTFIIDNKDAQAAVKKEYDLQKNSLEKLKLDIRAFQEKIREEGPDGYGHFIRNGYVYPYNSKEVEKYTPNQFELSFLNEMRAEYMSTKKEDTVNRYVVIAWLDKKIVNIDKEIVVKNNELEKKLLELE